MITANPSIPSLIYLFRHYEGLAKSCWDVYKDVADAAYMWDYYMEMAQMYERVLKEQL